MQKHFRNLVGNKQNELEEEHNSNFFL